MSSTTRGRARRRKAARTPRSSAPRSSRSGPPGSLRASRPATRARPAPRCPTFLRSTNRPSPSAPRILDDGVAIFSARGPVLRDGSNRIKPDIMAPGVGVRTSTLPSPRRRTSTASSEARPPPRLTSPERSPCSGRPCPASRAASTRPEELLEASAVPLTSAHRRAAGSPEATCPTRSSAGAVSTCRRGACPRDPARLARAGGRARDAAARPVEIPAEPFAGVRSRE